ncbi:MAG: hypothetical protein IPM54_06310 [Polyangiaceae bacterium]|nr:hypothetical protein [Polyangiaceae bacterium]
MLDDVLEGHAEQQEALQTRIDGILIGRVLSVEVDGAPYVTYLGAPPIGLSARTMVLLAPDDIGRDVALMFEGGDPERPVVVGRMVTPHVQVTSLTIRAEVDEHEVQVAAHERLVLRCGESSITLTRAGKIIIRGKYVLSQSAGVNRIQGGSVEIN